MRYVVYTVLKERKYVVMEQFRALLVRGASKERDIDLIVQKQGCSMTRCSNKKSVERKQEKARITRRMWF